MDRLRFAKAKMKPSGWHRRPCLAFECHQAEVQQGVCAEHAAQLLAEANADLLAVGAALVRKATVNDGYVWGQLRDDQQIYGATIHKMVMQAYLGRDLVKGENVHHINGHRSDNGIDNLELWVSAQPVGQRPDDLAEYARTLLARYGDQWERIVYGKGVEKVADGSISWAEMLRM